MQITMRLYRQHDMDLLNIYFNKAFPFTTEIKKTLRAYKEKRNYKIPVDNTSIQFKGYVKPHILIHINLNPKKDTDIIELLSQVQARQRNAFIKAVLRQSMTMIPLESFMRNDDLIMNYEVAYKMEEEALATENATPKPEIKKAPIDRPQVQKSTPAKPVRPKVAQVTRPVEHDVPAQQNTMSVATPISQVDPVTAPAPIEEETHMYSNEFDDDPFSTPSNTQEDDADLFATLTALAH